MVALGLCFLCRPLDFPGLAVAAEDVRHCYGAGDQPAPRGRFGGFRCTCACRGEVKPA